MLFVRAIILLPSVWSAAVTEKQSTQHQRNGQVTGNIEMNPEEVLNRESVNKILKDDNTEIKGSVIKEDEITYQVQFEAYKKSVKSYFNRPSEFIPRSEDGTSYGGIHLSNSIEEKQNGVSCGGHDAHSCFYCAVGEWGASWCGGDCKWNYETNVCEERIVACNSEPAEIITAPDCALCKIQDCTGSSECESMPSFMDGDSPSDCRQILGDDSRSASIHLNYITPSSIQRPAWLFMKLDILDASSSSFYNLNGHKYGYAGFQVSQMEPYDGRVVFSIWDQGGCDRDVNSNCPQEDIARTIACGTGIDCTNFSGEGTGRKSIVYSDNLPLLDDPYYIMTYARSLGEGTYRMQYSSFFFVPGNIDWDASNSAHSRNFVKTPPGWRFLSTIEVGTDSNDESGEQWWISHAHSFLEQWYGVDGTALRAGLYGPGFVAEETGDFVQLQEAAFHHGRIENYKHVNAYSDDSGSVGLEMGGEVTRNAFNGHLFTFPDATRPDPLLSFLPMRDCLSSLSFTPTTEDIEDCLSTEKNVLPTPMPTYTSSDEHEISANAHEFHGGTGGKNGAKAAKDSKTSPTAIQRNRKM